MYSKGTKSLAEDIHSTVEKAQEIYDSVLSAYPTMAKWMEKTIKDTYATGHVDNIYGRRRRLPDLLLPKFEFDIPSDEVHVIDFYKNFYTDKLNKVWKDSDVNKIKDEAREYGIFITDNRKNIAESYRKIINFCIQSSAAVITKRAMRNIFNNERLKELGVKLVLSIHDKETWNCRV